jgi:hypothetical protein
VVLASPVINGDTHGNILMLVHIITKRFLRSENTGFSKSQQAVAQIMLNHVGYSTNEAGLMGSRVVFADCCASQANNLRSSW